MKTYKGNKRILLNGEQYDIYSYDKEYYYFVVVNVTEGNYVTRDMATDAGEPSMEGMKLEDTFEYDLDRILKSKAVLV